MEQIRALLILTICPSKIKGERKKADSPVRLSKQCGDAAQGSHSEYPDLTPAAQQQTDGNHYKEGAPPMVGGVKRAIKVEYKKEQRRQYCRRPAENTVGDPEYGPTKKEPQHQQNSLHQPLVNSEEPENSNIQQIGPWENKSEEVAIG
jgi:hypothetical protein